MRLILIGKKSDLTFEINQLCINEYEVLLLSNDEALNFDFLDGDRIVYISAILLGKQIEDISETEVYKVFKINTINPILILKKVNQCIRDFVFCYVGSESAYKGSYDDAYFLSKAATTKYVKEFSLKSTDSRCFVIEPSTCEFGMTKKRTDLDRLSTIKKNLRIGRFIKSRELAKIILNLLSKDWEYLSNEIIKINNGKFAKNKR